MLPLHMPRIDSIHPVVQGGTSTAWWRRSRRGASPSPWWPGSGAGSMHYTEFGFDGFDLVTAAAGREGAASPSPWWPGSGAGLGRFSCERPDKPRQWCILCTWSTNDCTLCTLTSFVALAAACAPSCSRARCSSVHCFQQFALVISVSSVQRHVRQAVQERGAVWARGRQERRRRRVCSGAAGCDIVNQCCGSGCAKVRCMSLPSQKTLRISEGWRQSGAQCLCTAQPRLHHNAFLSLRPRMQRWLRRGQWCPTASRRWRARSGKQAALFCALCSACKACK